MPVSGSTISRLCIPSADGTRYAAYPAGDKADPNPDPEPTGGWELAAGEFAPSRITATITSPRPSNEISAKSRYLWAHSQFDYIVPVCVMGGAPPFFFTVSGVTGATIERKAPAFNPQCYSWAEVTIPAATVASWSSTQTITVSVFDQENTSTPVTSVSWLITKDDSKFIFLDAADGTNGGSGTIASPMKAISDYYRSSATDSTYVNKICVYKNGTYALDRWGTQPGTDYSLYWGGAYKPTGHIAYPGHTPRWDFSALDAYGATFHFCFWSSMNDWFFGGGLGSYGGKQHFATESTATRITFWDCDCDGLNQISGTNDNRGFFSTLGVTNPHNWIALADIRMKNVVNNAGANNGSVCVLYCVKNTSIDGVVFTNSQATDSIFLKSDIQRASVTGCSVWTGNTSSRQHAYMNATYNASYGMDKIIAARYCRTHQSADNAGAMYFGHDGGATWGLIYIDRVTHVSGSMMPLPANGDGYLSQSVVVNNRTPIVNADVVQSNNLTYTRSASPLDSEGRLPAGATKYTRGFEVKAAS